MLLPLPSNLRLAVRPWPALAVTAGVVAGALAITAGAANAAPAAKYRPVVQVRVKHRTLGVRGTDGADKLVLRLRAGRPDILEVDAGDDGHADAAISRRRFDRIVVEGRGGADTIRIDESAGVFTDTEQTTLDGGDGDDTLLGGSGAERLVGGEGADLVDGGRGNDVALLGVGDDTFRWDPGEGSDAIDGGAGHDVMAFNGANIDEKFDVSANGPRVRFTRNVGTITMDLGGVEQIDTATLGGADALTVHDLAGTGVTAVDTDLAGTPGGTTGDGQKDRIVVEGTAGNDRMAATGQAGSFAVTGAPALVRATHADTTDELAIDSLAGDDGVDASTLAADTAQLTIDGGAGDDRIDGGRGADLLLGGDGNDTVDGRAGNDVAQLGAGDDRFRWEPGEGSDTVDGQAGRDTLQFNGANIDEKFDVSANGPRVRFTRNVGTITMDLGGIEQLDTAALGGADTLTQGDLTGTDLTGETIDLAGTPGGTTADGQPDRVVVDGTAGNDGVIVHGDAAGVAVEGLHTQLTIAHPEAANDALTVDALAGDDVVEASRLAAGALHYTANGGDGNDVLIGSAGDDALNGGAGDDLLNGGPGIDALDGGPGQNVVIQ